MNGSPDHAGVAELSTGLSLAEPVRALSNRAAGYLLGETIFLTAVAILAIRILGQSHLSNTLWLVTTAVLVTAAMVPTITKSERFARIGLDVRQIKSAVSIVSRTCLVVFPATFAGLCVLKSRDWNHRYVLRYRKIDNGLHKFSTSSSALRWPKKSCSGVISKTISCG